MKEATLSAARSTICLNMIVKNEAPVIKRCVDSVKPLIDHWVIVDTGSTDGTQQIIKDALADVPGTLHEHPWKNFGHNRTEAIKLAAKEAEYILTIDADEILECTDDFEFGTLTHDAYNIVKRCMGREYRVPNLVRAACDWHWEGVLHEQPESLKAKKYSNLDNIVINAPREGARSRDPHTFKRDALLLEQDLLERPDNTRTVFYLAQSYRDAEDYELAIRNYKKRATMGGWREEVFISLYQIARLMIRQDKPWPECLEMYLIAHAHTPRRVEPLYHIGMSYARQKNWPLASLFLERAAEGRRYDNGLFIEADIYDWRAKMEAAVAAYWMGRHKQAITLNDVLLAEDYLPERHRKQVEKNRNLSIDALAEKAKNAPSEARQDSL